LRNVLHCFKLTILSKEEEMKQLKRNIAIFTIFTSSTLSFALSVPFGSIRAVASDTIQTSVTEDYQSTTQVLQKFYNRAFNSNNYPYREETQSGSVTIVFKIVSIHQCAKLRIELIKYSDLGRTYYRLKIDQKSNFDKLELHSPQPGNIALELKRKISGDGLFVDSQVTKVLRESLETLFSENINEENNSISVMPGNLFTHRSELRAMKVNENRLGCHLYGCGFLQKTVD